MRSMLLSTALVITALMSSGCATLTVDNGCDGCGVSATGCADMGCDSCCGEGRIGGLIGRLRGESACVDCGDNQVMGREMAMMGRGGMGTGIGAGRMEGGMLRSGMAHGALAGRGIGGHGLGARGMGGRGIGGRGILAGGFGRGAGCLTCGRGDCGGGLRCNHAPFTPRLDGMGPYGAMGDGPGGLGPDTGHYRYPYYTTRAPRDFLMANPPSIGR